MIGVLRIVAILLILAGLVWTGQGFGLIQGSVMTGSAFWAVMGLICLVAGGTLAWWSFARAGRQRA